MARRFFTADFHLGFQALMELEKWPFESIEQHDKFLLAQCYDQLNSSDILIHVGDLASYRYDNHLGMSSFGLGENPMNKFDDMKAQFVNIRGNHDTNNRVKSLCKSMRTNLGTKFPDVSISHYPTFSSHCESHFLPGDIHLHGHVHGAFRHCLDLDNQCLNINVGVMVWDFKILSEDFIVRYISSLLAKKPDDLYRCKSINGKITFFGDPTK